MKKLLIALLFAPALHAQVIDAHFKVDQVGYRTAARKVAVIADPQTGYNAPDPFTPGATLEVRRASDNMLMFSGTPVAWNGGNTHTQSGDKAWWFDFTPLSSPGDYFILDAAANKRSYTFRIADDVYNDALKHALRMFYYQRCGTPKAAAYAGADYTDAAPCHTGSLQDTDCRDVTAPNNSSLSRDLSGGWHDAGDYNKYTNFTSAALHYLLDAYEQNPLAFGDNNAIPESGNGVPDILDEIKWELDWLQKMQLADGSVLMKVSTGGFQSASPPSTDVAQRMYGAAASSATRTACAVFAHAAIVYSASSDPGMQAYGAALLARAQLAWTWLGANTAYSYYNNTGFGSANPEVAVYDQDALKITAAVYLFAATGNATYRSFVDANYTSIHALQWTYWYPFESVYQNALLYYTATPGATTATVNAIRSNCITSVSANNTDLLPAWNAQSDAYMAFMKDQDYVWNNNQFKCETGELFTNMLRYNLDAPNQAAYRNAGEGFVHYLHGTNPHGFAFLSNADVFGADNPVKEIYHGWFGDGTAFDNDNNTDTSYLGPPPGFLTCGVNAFYNPDVAYSGPPITPPQNQPVQKSYKDWNTSWPENSWEISEVGIYTNASYVKLLSMFADSAGITTAVPAQVIPRGLAIFPNPACDRFTVSGVPGTTYTVDIYDVKGSCVLHTSVASGSPVHTAQLVPGIYSCSITDGRGVKQVLKLVLVR